MRIFIVLACLWTPIGIGSTVLPALSWDPRNPLFACEHQTITVAPDDKLNVVCPNRAINYENVPELPNTENLYESAYLLQPDQEEKYRTCNAEGAKLITICNDVTKFRSVTLAFKEISGSGTAPVFKPGMTYFMIGTGFRTQGNVNQRVGGSCNNTDNNGPYNLKLKIKVCSREDVAKQNCSRCPTTSCYYKGCTNCSLWKKTPGSLMSNRIGKCYDFYHRTCTNNKLDVTYSEERRELVRCPATTPPPTTKAPTTQIETTISSTIPKPQVGPRQGEEKGNKNLYIVGFVCGIGGILLGVLVSYLAHRRHTRELRIKSAKFGNGHGVNGVQPGIANEAFEDATLVKSSPLPTQKMTHGSVAWQKELALTNHSNGVATEVTDGIEISCDTPVDSDRGGSKDQQL